MGLTAGEDYLVTQSRSQAMKVAAQSLRPAIIFTSLGKDGLRPKDCMRLANEVGRSVLTIGYDDERPPIEMQAALDGWMKPEPSTDYTPLQAFLHTYMAGVEGDRLMLGLRV